MSEKELMSCILCLEAFERATMLEVALRRGESSTVPTHIICMKCGAAIAAEYLYREREQRPQPASVAPKLELLEQPESNAEAPDQKAPGIDSSEPNEGDTSA